VLLLPKPPTLGPGSSADAWTSPATLVPSTPKWPVKFVRDPAGYAVACSCNHQRHPLRGSRCPHCGFLFPSVAERASKARVPLLKARQAGSVSTLIETLNPDRSELAHRGFSTHRFVGILFLKSVGNNRILPPPSPPFSGVYPQPLIRKNKTNHQCWVPPLAKCCLPGKFDYPTCST